jgi:hypothetical protein
MSSPKVSKCSSQNREGGEIKYQATAPRELHREKVLEQICKETCEQKHDTGCNGLLFSILESSPVGTCNTGDGSRTGQS